MSDETKVVFTVPSTKEVISRLATVQDDDVVRKFYKMIATKAGQGLAVMGIVNLFVNDLDEFLKRGQWPTVVRNLFYNWVPAWIDALVQDKKVAAMAKKEFEQARNPSPSP